MNHLSADELIDQLEGNPGPRVAAHLAACDRCRREAEALRATIGVVQGVEVPEPSPWFWQRFLARTREATAERPRWRLAWVRPQWPWALAAAGVLAMALAAGTIWPRVPNATPESPRVVGIERTAGDLQAPWPDMVALGDDAPWQVVADASEDLDWDLVSAAGFGPVLGSAERAVSALSEHERSELARLLRAELEGVSP